MPSKRTFPKHIGRSREWKARKRRELTAVAKALGVLQVGAAYMPIMQDFNVVMDKVARWQRDCSAKAWGR
jgi:hypothetical protein